MSMCTDSTTMLVQPASASGGSGMGNGAWGNDAWVLIILFALIFGWGRNGNGSNGSNDGGTSTVLPYILNSGSQGGYNTRSDVQRGFDNQSVMNKLNGIEQGICSLGYDQLNQMNGINTNIMSGFGRLDTSLCQLGNNITQSINGTNVALMQGQNALASQMADCCCKTQTAIQANTTQGVMNANAIQRQIENCCCDAEKQSMQTRFDMAQNNCSTLQAIDKVGDRIIDYLAAEKNQALRDENQALRLQASQTAQNQYLVNQLRPCPVPAYITCSPFQASYGMGLNNGCGCGC